MSIPDFATYKSRWSAPFQWLHEMKQGLAATSALGRMLSMWKAVGKDTGATPTTAAVPSSTIAGAIGQFDSSGVQRIASLNASSANGGTLFICDRLSHMGGLVGNVNTLQNTNLPTAALTRYTNGLGVFAAFEIYTALGATQTTITATYTSDSGGTSTSQATIIGGTGPQIIGNSIWMPLAQGDRGVKAVSDCTLAASTGTAGNFGVTLFAPLIAYPLQPFTENEVFDGVESMMANLPSVLSGACLYYQFVPYGGQAQTSVGSLQLDHTFIEE